MYNYQGIRQLESDIFETKAQVLKSPVSGIEVNSIRVIISEENFEQLQKDIKERINLIAEARGEEKNPEIDKATIEHFKFADIHVYFERIKTEDIDVTQY